MFLETKTEEIKITKTELAKRLGISRALLYYKHKRPLIDEEVKRQIESVLADNPSYGHKRIALALKLNKKRILRVMKKFNLKPYRKRKTPRKPGDEHKSPAVFPNLIKNLDLSQISQDTVWVSDFTFIRYQESFLYLATMMDLTTREIVGGNVSRFHNQELVLGALEQALSCSHHTQPEYLHSDQGSEYDSQAYTTTAQRLGIKISMSQKQSPWENAYQEAFYSQFKLDLGDPNRFNTLGELIEAIHQTLNYYNQRRIHTALKMSPVQFRKQQEFLLKEKLSDSSSSELGT